MMWANLTSKHSVKFSEKLRACHLWNTEAGIIKILWQCEICRDSMPGIRVDARLYKME